MASRAPGEPDSPAEPFPRRGLKLGAMLGVRGCTQLGCGRGDYELRAGPVVRGLLEYRFHPYVSLGGELGFGYHGIDTEEGENAFGSSLNLVAMAFVYPLPRTRFDPFVGLGFGFNQDRQRFNETGDDGERYQDWTNRGLLRASLGLDVFVTERLTVGPRLDYHLQFAGRICSEATTIRKDCVSVSDVDDEFRDELPRWIVFGVQLKARIGAKK